MRIVGIPTSFIEKTEDLEIKDYRAQLPCDLYEINQIRFLDKGNKEIYFRYSTDNFHMDTGRHFDRDYRGFTYKVQNSCIITSIREGKITLSYKAFPMDDEGYPLIPDNSSYSKALELYIKLQYFTILFDLGKIQPQVLQNTQQQYCWYVGQAQTDLIRPTLDQMESLSNMWNKLLPDTTRDHQTGYRYMGSQEKIIRH